MTPEEIVNLYRSKHKCPVTLGDMILACKNERQVTIHELAAKTGITAGTLHHYTSVAVRPLIREHVLAGRLTFKEARALADIRPNDWRRLEIINLFASGRISSMFVEQIVKYARDFPGKEVHELVNMATDKVAAVMGRAGQDPPRRVRIPRVFDTPTGVLAQALRDLAGQVEAWSLVNRCEVERLPVLTAARRLDDGLHRTVLARNGNGNGSTAAVPA